MAKKEDLEYMKELRAIGVKTFKAVEGDILEVEFFPRTLLDVTEFGDSDPNERATEPPPAPSDDVPEFKVPKAMANILRKGSVS